MADTVIHDRPCMAWYMNMACLSHTIMHIGEHLEIEILTKFREGSQDCSLYANNLKTKVLLMVHGARECFNKTIILRLPDK